jgi:hypothetical protein
MPGEMVPHFSLRRKARKIYPLSARYTINGRNLMREIDEKLFEPAEGSEDAVVFSGRLHPCSEVISIGGRFRAATTQDSLLHGSVDEEDLADDLSMIDISTQF